MLIIKQLLYSILLLTLTACKFAGNNNDSATENEPTDVYDLAEIKEHGELRALVDYSTTSYFLYRGRPMGFEYELLNVPLDLQRLIFEVLSSKIL